MVKLSSPILRAEVNLEYGKMEKELNGLITKILCIQKKIQNVSILTNLTLRDPNKIWTMEKMDLNNEFYNKC